MIRRCCRSLKRSADEANTDPHQYKGARVRYWSPTLGRQFHPKADRTETPACNWRDALVDYQGSRCTATGIHHVRCDTAEVDGR